MPLVDASPLIVADELGLFDAQGVRVELHRELGWATIRQKMLYNEIDAAHAPAGLVLSLRLGIEGQSLNTLAPFVINLNGNAITLSTSLYQKGVRSAADLRKLIRSTPERLITLAVVARSSSHNFLMRTWLKSGGINPDTDVRIITLPPSQMSGALSAGLLDGYCAGEPWNSVAVRNGCGWCPAISSSISPEHPEKVLMTTEAFAAEHPRELLGLIRALDQACAFCDDPAHRQTLPQILRSSFVHRDEHELAEMSLTGPFDNGISQSNAANFHIFHREGTNRPTPEKANWLVHQFVNNGIIPQSRSQEAHDAMTACWTDRWYNEALGTKPARRRTFAKSKPTAVTA